MRLKTSILFFLTVQIFSDPVFAEEKVKFPVVVQQNGITQMLAKNEEARNLKATDILKEKARLRTKEKSQLKLALDEHTTLTILENSQIEIPVIDWDSGEVSEVHLISGSLRVDSQGTNQRNYSTPISKDVYTDADFLLNYNPATARLTMVCFRGALDLRGYEGETTARVGAGERAYFQGILESGAPSFDILLKGRKLARGKLSAVEKIPETELASMQSVSLVQKPPAPKKAKKAPRTPDQICDEPYGKLNECVWTCEGMPQHPKTAIKSCDTFQCVRRRCDANGQWSDEYKSPASEGKCDVIPKVSPCDY